MTTNIENIPPGLVVSRTAPQSAELKTWRVGQLLDARVVSGEGGGRATLRIQGHLIPVQTRVPLEAGVSLKLQVHALGPTLILKLVSGQPSAVGVNESLRSAVRQLLPRQGPITAAIQAVSNRSLGSSAGTSYAEPALQQALGELSAQVPGYRQLFDAAGLRRAIHASGLLHEARHKANADQQPSEPTKAADLKAALLRLLPLLPTTSTRAGTSPPLGIPQSPLPNQPPPGPGSTPLPQSRLESLSAAQMRDAAMSGVLRREVESALARLVMLQTATLEATREQEALNWLVEIPLRHPRGMDTLALRFEQERSRSRQSEDDRWSVMLAMDLPGLGPLHVRVTLAQQRISTVFWVQRKPTTQQIEASLGRLADALTQRGMEVGTLGCRMGSPPEPSPHRQSAGLVSERA